MVRETGGICVDFYGQIARKPGPWKAWVTMHLVSRQIPGLLVNGGPVLSLDDSLSVDLHNCLEQVPSCQSSISCSVDEACLSHLQRAELLPGWYDDWVILEQNRLRTFRLRALVRELTLP